MMMNKAATMKAATTAMEGIRTQTQVLLTCSKDDAAIHLWNPATGHHLRTYKNNTSGRPNAWSLVGQHHMLAIQETRPAIHVWSWSRVRTLLVPLLLAVAENRQRTNKRNSRCCGSVFLRSWRSWRSRTTYVDRPSINDVYQPSPPPQQGLYCAAGAPSGKLYLWQVGLFARCVLRSICLCRNFLTTKRRVLSRWRRGGCSRLGMDTTRASLRFPGRQMPCSFSQAERMPFFPFGPLEGASASCHADHHPCGHQPWQAFPSPALSLFGCSEEENSTGQSTIQPEHTWNEHALPITSIFCGVGGISGRIVTTSKDQTCKVHSCCKLGSVPRAINNADTVILDVGHSFTSYGGLSQVPLVPNDNHHGHS